MENARGNSKGKIKLRRKSSLKLELQIWLVSNSWKFKLDEKYFVILFHTESKFTEFIPSFLGFILFHLDFVDLCLCTFVV